jgi:hypothetical protein
MKVTVLEFGIRDSAQTDSSESEDLIKRYN